ncbi:hypothetical protein CN926_00725 [Bacillus thuringiensis]|nr:hypothetical protein CN926_00725 [Bacillus thuringiensis]
MITVTVETKQGFNEELCFLNEAAYDNFVMVLRSNFESTRRAHGFERSIMLKDITKVISVEEEN